MHVQTIVHGGDFNKYDNFNFTDLFYAWLTILKRGLDGNENLTKKKKYIFDLLGSKD